MPYKVVFSTDRGKWHQEAALAAAPEGLEVTTLRSPDGKQLRRALKTADFWISERSGRIDRALLRGAQELKLIQRLGSMVHDIDLAEAKKRGIAVCYQPVEGAIRVAEHLVLQMLSISKNIREVEKVALEASQEWGECLTTDEDTFCYNWSGRTGIGQLWNRTVGIIGFGEIGVELARRLGGWGCRVLYHKRSPLPEQIEKELDISYQDPAVILEESDTVVNLLPYLPETVGYFNEQRIKQMKKGAILVSCGSGGTIDESALTAAVLSGHLHGAALDTYALEPLQEDNPLLLAARRGENILLTPHTAGGTEDDLPPGQPPRWRDYSNILRYLKDQPLKNQLV